MSGGCDAGLAKSEVPMKQRLFQPVLLFFLMISTAACSTPVELQLRPTNQAVQMMDATRPQPAISGRPLQQSTNTQIPEPEKTALPAFSPEPALTPTPTLFPEKVLHTVSDDYQAIKAILPEAWIDMRNEPWVDGKNQVIGTTFISSTNVEDFLSLKAEGVAISVSNRLGKGYIQLLDEESKLYRKICEDTYKTTWTIEHPVYKGKYIVLGCSSNPDSWLTVEAMVNKQASGAYVVRVIALDMVPTYGDQFRDIINQFQVFPENIP
jgi:hypothetical protein